ncbi:unnamed protein product, partial [Prorocentrum cordatum]
EQVAEALALRRKVKGHSGPQTGVPASRDCDVPCRGRSQRARGAGPAAWRVKAENDGQHAKPDLGFKGAQKALQALLLKFLLQLGQSKRNIEGVVLDCLIVDGTSQEDIQTGAQGLKYNEAVTAPGKGHAHGPPHLWVSRGLLMALLHRKDVVGTASAKKIVEMKQVIETWNMAKRCDMIKSCKMDRCYDVNKRKLMLNMHPHIR